MNGKSRFERGRVLAASAQISKIREIPSSIAAPLTVWSVESERTTGKFYQVVEKGPVLLATVPTLLIGEKCVNMLMRSY